MHQCKKRLKSRAENLYKTNDLSGISIKTGEEIKPSLLLRPELGLDNKISIDQLSFAIVLYEGG